MNWKIIVAFLVGGGIGGVVGWQITKKHYEAEAEAEIQDIKKFYIDKLDELTSDAEEINPLTIELSEEQKEEVQKAWEDEKTYHKLVTPYHQMSKPSLEDIRAEAEHPEEDDSEDLEGTGISEIVEQAKPSSLPGPIVISEEEYISDYRFEKVTITYYKEDQTLADEDETIIDDVEAVVSQKAIDELVAEDLDAVYVRNERLGIDYEVAMNENSYHEVVLGILDDDEEVGGRVSMKNRRIRRKEEDDE